MFRCKPMRRLGKWSFYLSDGLCLFEAWRELFSLVVRTDTEIFSRRENPLWATEDEALRPQHQGNVGDVGASNASWPSASFHTLPYMAVKWWSLSKCCEWELESWIRFRALVPGQVSIHLSKNVFNIWMFHLLKKQQQKYKKISPLVNMYCIASHVAPFVKVVRKCSKSEI